VDGPRFVLHKCLGAGGFGEVYLATENTEGGITREVALKVLHEALDEDSDAVKRLRDEGQVLAMLAHPAILGVHEFARVDGRLSLVTEYVEGADLAWFCVEERRVPPRIAYLVTLAVAEALDFAWKSPNPQTGRPLHLIHRDVKPENVRITRAGQVKVLDFGVARSTEMQRRAKTAMGDVILTPGYGAPETLQFGVLGPAVDVFALGVTLYNMVTAETFYDNEDIGSQVLLASDSVEFGNYLDERLSLVEDRDLYALLRDMLEFAHELRPSMAEVAERCERLSRRVGGPSLLQWSKTAVFPEVAAKVGRLDGAHVDFDGSVTFPESKPEPVEDAPVPTTWIIPEGELPDDAAPAEPSEVHVTPTAVPLAELEDEDDEEAIPREEPPAPTPEAAALPDEPTEEPPPPPSVGASLTPVAPPARAVPAPAGASAADATVPPGVVVLAFGGVAMFLLGAGMLAFALWGV
jgi:serine/threonine-protein kinase